LSGAVPSKGINGRAVSRSSACDPPAVRSGNSDLCSRVALFATKRVLPNPQPAFFALLALALSMASGYRRYSLISPV
jgi:hypothetical protein